MTIKNANPTTDTELKLVRIWKEVLQKENISIHDNFFEIGGDSIKAMAILSKVKKEVGNINISKFFQYQTISEICSYYDEVISNDKIDQSKRKITKTMTKAESDEIMDLFD